MAYSRWGGSFWYTYWACQDEATENRDTALFEISCVATFTAAELRADMESCLCRARLASTPKLSISQLEELRSYMKTFLADVDRWYPEGSSGETPCMDGDD